MKTRSIFLNTLLNSRKSILFWILGMAVMTLMIMGVYDSMADQYAGLFESMPKGFEAIVGDTAYIGTPAGFLGMEMFSMVLPLSLAIIGISAGASVIGREEDHGTLELLLASPVSRGRILLEKSAAIAVQLLLVGFGTWLAVVAGTIMFPFDISLVNVAKALLSSCVLGLLFAYLALATQTLTGNRGLAIGVGAGTIVLTYFANTLAPLVDKIKNLQYASPFHYYDGQNILVNGLAADYIGVLVGISLLFLIVAWLGFRRRDIGV